MFWLICSCVQSIVSITLEHPNDFLSLLVRFTIRVCREFKYLLKVGWSCMCAIYFIFMSKLDFVYVCKINFKMARLSNETRQRVIALHPRDSIMQSQRHVWRRLQEEKLDPQPYMTAKLLCNETVKYVPAMEKKAANNNWSWTNEINNWGSL